MDINPLELFGVIPDIDRKILLHIRNDKFFRPLILINKCLSSICDEYFWYRRFINKYKCDLNNYGKINYKSLYLRLSQHTIKKNFKYAIRQGYLELVIYYIAYRSKIKAQFNFTTAYKRSCVFGHLPLIDLFIEKGMNIYQVRLGLEAAIRNDHLHVLIHLRKLGMASRDVLRWAVICKNYRIVKYILSEDKNKSLNYDQKYLIRIAVRNNSLEILKCLLSYYCYEFNKYAIYLAIIGNNIDIVKYVYPFLLPQDRKKAVELATPDNPKLLEFFREQDYGGNPMNANNRFYSITNE